MMALALSILSLLISISAGIISFFKLKESKKASKISLGNSELSLRVMITNARNRIDDLYIEFNKIDFLEGKSEEAKKVYEKAIWSSIENSLNVYEKACSLYIDGKLDKKRFKRDYKNEIRGLINNNRLYNRYLAKKTSDFGAIIRVADEWFNTESDSY